MASGVMLLCPSLSCRGEAMSYADFSKACRKSHRPGADAPTTRERGDAPVDFFR